MNKRNAEDIIHAYIMGQAELATLGQGSLVQYDMIAPAHPRHERADHWPEGWNPPTHELYTRERRYFTVAQQEGGYEC